MIEANIAEGCWDPGTRLPSEAGLFARFDGGRGSRRRAVADLAYDGKLSVELGWDTLVADTQVVIYRIGKRTRRRENFAAQSGDVSGRLLPSERPQAPCAIAAALDLAPGAPVYRQTRLTTAERLPFDLGSSWHLLSRFPDFVERREVIGSMTETYKSDRITDYSIVRRQWTSARHVTTKPGC